MKVYIRCMQAHDDDDDDDVYADAAMMAFMHGTARVEI